MKIVIGGNVKFLGLKRFAIYSWQAFWIGTPCCALSDASAFSLKPLAFASELQLLPFKPQSRNLFSFHNLNITIKLEPNG